MRKCRGMARPRQQGPEALWSLGWLEGVMHAKPQHLRQVVEQAGGGQERVGRPRVQDAGLGHILQRLDRVLAQDAGVRRAVYELQVLGDELQVDQAAAHLLELPRIARSLLFLDARAHVAHVGGGLGPVARLEERSEEHTSELQSLTNLVCRLLLETK